MHRSLLIAALAAALIAACAASFEHRRTPSGEFCSDMKVLPAGHAPEVEYHRLQPVASDPECRTEAERLESLRKAACKIGADAVIEAANEEIRLPNASYSIVSSGTAVIWVRHSNAEPKPLTTHPDRAPSAAPDAGSVAAEAPPVVEEPPPVASAAPAKSGQPAAGPAKSGKAAAGAAPKNAPSASPSATPSASPSATPSTPKKK
jgi:hypothetical protein